MSELTFEDLKVGSLYRGKRFKKLDLGNNDRVIVWIGKKMYRDEGYTDMIQYDSDTVKPGRKLPITSALKFLKWAKEIIEK